MARAARSDGRRVRGGDRGPAGEARGAGVSSPGSLLLVSYFYPPTRDTGAQRPAAMAKYLARLGWRVTVLTTSAFGEEAGDAVHGVSVIRTFDMQTWRARMAGHDRVDSLFDSDSYTGKAHPLSKVIVPEPLAVAWAPFARRAALAAHRRQKFDCVLTTSPPSRLTPSAGRCSAAAPAGSPTFATPGRSSPCASRSRPGSSIASTTASSGAGSAPPTR